MWLIASRDVRRNVRQPAWLPGAVVRPALWLLLLGAGLSRGFTGLPLGVGYQQYAFPGVVAMNILFTGIMSGASIVWDREFGFLKEIMVSPASRLAIIGGKVLGGAVLALVQGSIALGFAPFIGVAFTASSFVATVSAMIAIAVAVTSVGALLATAMESIEGFGSVNNFLAMPLFILSGAMYPLTNVPDWLKYLVYLNPFTYAVELLRGTVLRLNGEFWPYMGEMVLLALVMLLGATYLMNRRQS